MLSVDLLASMLSSFSTLGKGLCGLTASPHPMPWSLVTKDLYNLSFFRTDSSPSFPMRGSQAASDDLYAQIGQDGGVVDVQYDHFQFTRPEEVDVVAAPRGTSFEILFSTDSLEAYQGLERYGQQETPSAADPTYYDNLSDPSLFLVDYPSTHHHPYTPYTPAESVGQWSPNALQQPHAGAHIPFVMPQISPHLEHFDNPVTQHPRFPPPPLTLIDTSFDVDYYSESPEMSSSTSTEPHTALSLGPTPNTALSCATPASSVAAFETTLHLKAQHEMINGHSCPSAEGANSPGNYLLDSAAYRFPMIAHEQEPLGSIVESDEEEPPGFPHVLRQTVTSPATKQAASKTRKRAATFQCDICHERLTAKHNLLRHVDSHYGIKRYPCTCGRRFTTMGDLRRHQKSPKHFSPL